MHEIKCAGRRLLSLLPGMHARTHAASSAAGGRQATALLRMPPAAQQQAGSRAVGPCLHRRLQMRVPAPCKSILCTLLPCAAASLRLSLRLWRRLCSWLRRCLGSLGASPLLRALFPPGISLRASLCHLPRLRLHLQPPNTARIFDHLLASLIVKTLHLPVKAQVHEFFPVEQTGCLLA